MALIKDPKIKAKQDSILANEKTSFGTIIEYDEKGNVVWSWKSSKYFTESDLKYYNPPYRVHAVDVHENSFFFDEKENVIYISFKNIARILKIQYPDGNVLNAYGEIYKPDAFEKGNGLFCDQHSCRRSEQGYLYLFNNNSCNEGKQLPKVVMMQEPVNKNDSLKIIWEYECSLDGLDTSWQSEMKERKQKMFEKQRQKLADIKQPMWPGGMPQNSHTTSGGNVIELPDHSLFVCMNSQYGKMFIIDQDKKNLWSAIAEKWRQNEKKWLAIPQQYRASIISRKELEQLIWNGEN